MVLCEGVTVTLLFFTYAKSELENYVQMTPTYHWLLKMDVPFSEAFECKVSILTIL